MRGPSFDFCWRNQNGGAPSFAQSAKGGNRTAGAVRFSALGVRDKVQAMRVRERGRPPSITSHRIGSIVPALAKNARTGHPQFRKGKQKTNFKARATRPQSEKHVPPVRVTRPRLTLVTRQFVSYLI